MALRDDYGLVPDLHSLLLPGRAANYAGQVMLADGRRAVAAGVPTDVMDAFQVLWLFRCDAIEVRRSGVMTWEGLEASLVGLGRFCGQSVAVYDKRLAVVVVDRSIVDMPEGTEDIVARVAAQRMIDDALLGANIGPGTPFFLL